MPAKTPDSAAVRASCVAVRHRGFVYVIEADNGDVKVGVSGTPYARLSKVKREYGPSRGFKDARLVGLVACADPLAVESRAIQAIAGFATGGEWFAISPMQALVEVLWAAIIIEEAPYVRWPGQCRP